MHGGESLLDGVVSGLISAVILVLAWQVILGPWCRWLQRRQRARLARGGPQPLVTANGTHTDVQKDAPEISEWQRRRN